MAAIKKLKTLLTPEGLTGMKVKKVVKVKPAFPGFKGPKAAKVKIKIKNAPGVVPLSSLFSSTV